MTGISYNKARQDYLDLFRCVEKSGVREVVFCGVDEVAEVAYQSLKETGLNWWLSWTMYGRWMWIL